MAADDIRVSYLSPLASASGMMTMYVYNAALIHIAHYNVLLNVDVVIGYQPLTR